MRLLGLDLGLDVLRDQLVRALGVGDIEQILLVGLGLARLEVVHRRWSQRWSDAGKPRSRSGRDPDSPARTPARSAVPAPRGRPASDCGRRGSVPERYFAFGVNQLMTTLRIRECSGGS